MRLEQLSTYAVSAIAQVSTRHRPRRGGEETPPDEFRHEDWNALANRFASDEGVDYRTFRRVVRLLEEYIYRLSQGRPELFNEPTQQLVFYLNAFNALAVYTVLQNDPVASLQQIPHAWTRPWPVGRENLSLSSLLHSKLRTFGDPRIHAALVPAARSAARLRGYHAATLDTELDRAMNEYLATAVPETPERPCLILPQPFRSFAGDFIAPEDMPSWTRRIQGYLAPAGLRPLLRKYLTAEAAAILDDPAASIRFAPYDWALNDRAMERVSPIQPASLRRSGHQHQENG